jgi:hypothetical protein
MKPNFAFSDKAIKSAIESNPIYFFLRAPLSPFLWLKTIFQSVSDAELKVLQSKVRKYLFLLLISAVCMMAAAAIGFAAAFHAVKGAGTVFSVHE